MHTNTSEEYMDDKENELNTNEYATSIPYLIYILIVGISLFGLLIYLGFIGYKFWVTVLVGAAAQVIFRVSKKTWSNQLNKSSLNEDNSQSNPVFLAILESLPTFSILALLYVSMLFITGLLYGIGSIIRYVFS